MDSDGDGVGDVCDAMPLGGGGGDGGGQMSMPAGGDMLATSTVEPEPVPEPVLLPTVSASFVVHETGDDAVVLPPGGGTVVVDLVLVNDGPIALFEGKPAVDGPGTLLSVASANWSNRANVLMSYGLGDVTLASYYECTLMAWYLFYTDGRPDPPIDPLLLLEDDGMNAIVLAVPLDVLAGPVATPQGELVTTSASLGSLTRELLPAGQTVVATLTLEVANVPGTYQLTWIDGYFLSADKFTGEIEPGPALTITVPAE